MQFAICIYNICCGFFSDVESRPWDFQAEECSLRCAVDQFNHRRYQRELPSGAQQMQQSQEKSVNETYGPEVKDAQYDLKSEKSAILGSHTNPKINGFKKNFFEQTHLE